MFFGVNRFFGRFALDYAVHDEETLKAIRENAHGLRGIIHKQKRSSIHLMIDFYLDIAGERLWIELKRIAEGRNAGAILKVMLEQNIGQYLGKIRYIFFMRILSSF